MSRKVTRPMTTKVLSMSAARHAEHGYMAKSGRDTRTDFHHDTLCRPKKKASRAPVTMVTERQLLSIPLETI